MLALKLGLELCIAHGPGLCGVSVGALSTFDLTPSIGPVQSVNEVEDPGVSV